MEATPTDNRNTSTNETVTRTTVRIKNKTHHQGITDKKIKPRKTEPKIQRSNPTQDNWNRQKSQHTEEVKWIYPRIPRF
jgi:hypothetical protein